MKITKTFEAFVLQDLEDEYDIVLELWDNGKYLELSKIEIPKSARGKGIGTEVMEKICKYADERGVKIYLTPSTSFGATSKSRLEEFYKGFGFIKNTDKSESKDTMVRMPEISEGKKPKSTAQKIKDVNKKLSKIAKKGEDTINKMKEIQDKQKEGEAAPSDKLTTSLLKTQAQMAKADMQKTSLKKQELALKQKVKSAKDAEKAKKKVEKETEEITKESMELNEKNPCWDGYVQLGMKDKDGRQVPNCVPEEDVEESASSDTYNDYPAAAKKNAKKAIDWKEEHGRDEVQGGTEVGWQRAHQLAKGEALSRDVVSRMAQFNRHRKNSKLSAEFKGEPWKDNGYIAWLIWGGDEGVDWAMDKMEQIKKEEETKNENTYTMKKVKLFEDFVSEATTSWAKMMKGVRAGDTGPWSIVAIDGKKVVGQRYGIVIKDLIPAEFEALRKEFPKAKIHIEDATGAVVWNESMITEGKNFKVGQTWEWHGVEWDPARKNDYKVVKKVKIIEVQSNGDVIGQFDGQSDTFIVRDASKYLKKKLNESSVVLDGSWVDTKPLSRIDHTRVIKWIHNELDDAAAVTRSGNGYTIDTSDLDKEDIQALIDYLKSQGYLQESKINENEATATQQLADEVSGELYKSGPFEGSVTATTTTKTWDDGVPVLKYLARGKAQSVKVKINRSFDVVHDVAHGWFYFTDGGKWYGLHVGDGYNDIEDLPFSVTIAD